MLIKTAVFVFILIVLSPFVHAQELCGDTKKVIDGLEEEHGEHVKAFGTNGEDIVLIFVNEKTQTFTIVRSNGATSCLIIAGEDFEWIDTEQESY